MTDLRARSLLTVMKPLNIKLPSSVTNVVSDCLEAAVEMSTSVFLYDSVTLQLSLVLDLVLACHFSTR